MSHVNLIPGTQGVRLSTLSPKYLHTNSTSHTWPFSAVAELIDNAYDPDVNASQLFIDVRRYEHEFCLTFTDNGAGMDSLKLHKMLSFGFCEKVAVRDHLPVGHYGNGFKSGSMRLGKDALVFTQDGSTRSVGFLSQTYLVAVKADTILVPIVTWDSGGNMIQRSDGDKALQDIYKHSLFKNEKSLMTQFDEIQSSKGTRIIIYNVRKTADGKPEFDFKTDITDIRIPDDVDADGTKYKRQERQNHIPESDYSLRAYCSILYLRPRMQIILRNKKVRTTVIAKSLSKTEVDTYKPQWVTKPIKITFGFSQNRNHYGIMMYHRNRLIKPYERVGYQLKANNQGVGVIGVIQCDFLQPTHNKQDFDYTKTYRAAMSALGTKLNDYWNEKKGRQQPSSSQVLPEPKEVDASPDQLWVQCDNPKCLKWRKLPPNVKSESLPDKWYCRNHPQPEWQSCDTPEQLEEDQEDVVQPYVKKQKRRLEKEIEERKKKERDQKAQKERELETKRQELHKKEKELQRLLKTVEEKSNKQKETLQKQKAAVKVEPPSPQKLQVKLPGVPHTPTVAVAQKKYLVQQNSSQRVVLTPVSSTPATPNKLITPVPSTSATPNRVLAAPARVVRAVTPSGKVINLVQGTTSTSTQVATPTMAVQPGVKIIKVGPPGNTPIMVTQTPASSTKVQLVTSQSAIQQVAGMPKIVSVTGSKPQTPTRTVMLVRTVPSSQQVQTVSQMGTVQLKSPNNPNIQGIQIINPATTVQTQPSTTTPSTYQPLESLKQVNKHAAENSISPVSAVMETPQQRTSQPLKRDAVTMNERYCFIVPSAQDKAAPNTPAPNTPAPMPKPIPTPKATSVQFVKISPRTVASTGAQTQTTMVKVEPQMSPAVVGNIHEQVQSLANAQVVASSPTVTFMVKKEPQETPRALPGVKRPLAFTRVDRQPTPQKPKPNDDDVIVIDPPSPPVAKKARVIPNGFTKDIDKDIIDSIARMDDMERLGTLCSRTQQLFRLRENVCKLLRVLVPELEVDDRKEILADTTIDQLLGQVLEQAITKDANGAS